MSNAAVTGKTTITVSEDFYEDLIGSAGHRKVGAYIEKYLSSLVAAKANLVAVYKAMVSDSEREQQAQEWCAALNGETLKNETW